MTVDQDGAIFFSLSHYCGFHNSSDSHLGNGQLRLTPVDQIYEGKPNDADCWVEISVEMVCFFSFNSSLENFLFLNVQLRVLPQGISINAVMFLSSTIAGS